MYVILVNYQCRHQRTDTSCFIETCLLVLKTPSDFCRSNCTVWTWYLINYVPGRNGYVHPSIFLFKLNINSLIIIIGLDTCTWFNHINTYFRVFLFLIKWKSILITFGSMTQIETRHFWATLVHMISKKTKAVVYWFLNSIICKYIRNTFNTNIYKLLIFLKETLYVMLSF